MFTVTFILTIPAFSGTHEMFVERALWPSVFLQISDVLDGKHTEGAEECRGGTSKSCDLLRS